jgi:hypothetical protein
VGLSKHQKNTNGKSSALELGLVKFPKEWDDGTSQAGFLLWARMVQSEIKLTLPIIYSELVIPSGKQK